jgi:hypothetical protein
MSRVSERRKLITIIVLFLIGWSMVALADLLDSYWPLFVTPIPYAVIPWLIARTDRPWPEVAGAEHQTTPTT